MTALEVLTPGPLCTVQDRGRPGHSGIGVGWSGAADRAAHDAANRLVGNTVDAATLEATFGGLRVRARGQVVAAVVGAECSVTVGGIADGMECTLILNDGDELSLGTPTSGLRTYLAVRGGIDVPKVLGSRSTDTMSGLGPPPLEPGTVLAVGDDASDWPATQSAPRARISGPIGIVPGPRADWFENPSALFEQEWIVTADADRVGVRLEGDTALVRSDSTELPSEGMVIGALQVPPDGKPVVFLADHPVTGGYPVIGVVRSADLPRLGQLRPGDSVRFTACAGG